MKLKLCILLVFFFHCWIMQFPIYELFIYGYKVQRKLATVASGPASGVSATVSVSKHNTDKSAGKDVQKRTFDRF